MNSKVDSVGAGAGLLINYEGEPILIKGYGLENYSRRIPISPNSNFRMASVSKQFTALAILTLIDAGKLSYDSPVNIILDIDGMEGVQIHHLLNHTSGIPSYEDYFENEWKEARIAENHHVLEWYRENHELSFEPGTEFEYSNGGYNLLATIVEEVSGMPFMLYAREFVFRPFGMKTTDYFNLAHPNMIFNRAYCYDLNDQGQWVQVDGNKLNGLQGEGAVYTNLADYAAFDKNLRSKKVLSNQLFDTYYSDNYSIPFERNLDVSYLRSHPVHYSNGWYVTPTTVFHSGAWIGARTFVIRDLDRPLTVAVFRNSNEEAHDLAEHVYDLVDSYLTKE